MYPINTLHQYTINPHTRGDYTMKATVEFMDAVLAIMELAAEQLSVIEYEVREPVQGTSYNEDDILDAKENIATVQKFIDEFYA